MLKLKDMSLQELICCKAWSDKSPVGNMLLFLLLMYNYCWLLAIVVHVFWKGHPLHLKQSPGYFLDLPSLIANAFGALNSALP